MQCNMLVHLICGVYYCGIVMTTYAISFTMYVLFFILSLLKECKIDNILSLQWEVLYGFTFIQQQRQRHQHGQTSHSLELAAALPQRIKHERKYNKFKTLPKYFILQGFCYPIDEFYQM